ncbi:type 2 periplasmic-binding domain-containing protein [Teichococcus aestuarii]|uniref:hypothetical protein n=1 Tax=Teichococcus aestuarii TaxID=568898 RepID=UPI0036100BA2
MSAENWRPVLEGFNRRYPKIKVETLDLPNSREVFERYLAERGTNSRTADLLATADPSGWIEFQQRGEVMPYESPEAAAGPPGRSPGPASTPSRPTRWCSSTTRCWCRRRSSRRASRNSPTWRRRTALAGATS